MDAAAYSRALKKLLPPGVIWRLIPESVLSKLFTAVGDEFARVDARGEDWIEETDPRTATETLDDWERALGLPDEDVLTVPVTDEERRLAVVQKVLRTGGQDAAYFIGIAVACGYGAGTTVTDDYGLTVARVGRARAGDRLRGAEWAFLWQMNVEPPSGAALDQATLERIIRRIAPAHTVVQFVYA
jgi:uncharacterized protein YmfQ (DUF2313 family)